MSRLASSWTVKKFDQAYELELKHTKLGELGSSSNSFTSKYDRNGDDDLYGSNQMSHRRFIT